MMDLVKGKNGTMIDKVHRTLSFAMIGPMAVLYESDENHTDTEWRSWLDFVGEKSRMHGKAFKLFVFSDGGTPSPTQRKESKDIMPDYNIPIAVCTEALFVKHAVTAFIWFKITKIKAFHRFDIDKAAEYLGAKDPTSKQAISNAVSDMRKACIDFKAPAPRIVGYREGVK